MDALLLQRSQDDEPSLSGALESGDIYPPDYSAEPGCAVRQDTEFAEIALRCHNDDPSNEVKYELIEATMSNFMFEGSRNYGHVNFTTRAKQDGSEEELFFAELNLRDSTTLTCFCSLKEMEDQIGGRMEMEMDTEAIGVVDLYHCYACDNALKHPRDGASYQAGLRIGPRH
ncbi:hypothetical protein HU200_058816 [Digitaria exilis]|uniref:DUF3615 domain-containing protein n=1 Tax=Digitaria exilis TaxID=1010633 RepID=A0A835E3Q8_9POAL|nr:hypothetical protein HU200_058816 [Digitaria exilis]